MKLIPELSNRLIEILGEDRINQIFELVKSKPVSFSTLKFMIRRKNILKDIRDGKSVTEIVKQYGLSKMTVYRLIKNNGKSNT